MKIVAKIFFLGILTAFLAIVFEQLAAVAAQFFSSQEIILQFYKNITWFLFLAVIIEEGLKYIALYLAVWEKFKLRRKKFIAASFFFGVSFGLAEISLVFFSNPDTGILARNLDREIMISLSSIVLIQAATSFLVGSLIATQEKIRRFSFLKILIFPALIHLLYNFLVIQKGNYTDFLVLATLVISYLISLIIIAANWRGIARQ
jgi:RsiW-degrading membrane proteinase PrsW (M82 family)